MNTKDFFNKEFLLKRVQDCEGLSEIEEFDDYIEAYDEYEDMYLRFTHNINFDRLFHFGSFKVDKNKFYNLLKCLDEILFLMPQDVYFISNEEELDNLLKMERYKCQSMNFKNTLGINWVLDSTIVINVHACRKSAEGISRDFGDNFEDCFNEAVWTTLIHELRHMVCDLGIIIPEEIIPSLEAKEENVEDYCNSQFWDSLYYKDFICFY